MTSNVNAVCCQGLKFFTTPAKNKRVPTFEAYNLLAFPGKFDQQRVDLLLAHGVFVSAFSCVDALCRGRQEIQHFCRHQVVINNDIGTL